MTRKQREAEEDALIEASIQNTNAECDFEVGSRRPVTNYMVQARAAEKMILFADRYGYNPCSDILGPYSPADVSLTLELGRRLWWLFTAPFALDLVACAETNS